MASEAGIAKALLQIALGLGPAFRGSPASFSDLVRGGAFSHGMLGTTSSMDKFVAQNYPSDFAPGSYHTYDVQHMVTDGKADMNSVGRGFKPLIESAGRMQTLKEHNDALTKFIRPGMSKAELQFAIEEGRKAEKELPQFWNESDEKVNPHRAQFGVSSSAVSGIRLTPEGSVQVRWRNKKGKDSQWYTYRQYPDVQQASVAAQELLSSPSIGRAVMPFQRNGQMLKFKDPSLYSAWSVKNYDTGYA